MISKKIFAAVFAMTLVFLLTSCKGENTNDLSQESTTAYYNIVSENGVAGDLATEAVTGNDSVVTETVNQSVSQTTSAEATASSMQAENITTEIYDETQDWTTEKIVEEYKNAARKSNSTAKTSQKIDLKKISLNNGEYDKFFSVVMPIISKFLDSNSTEKVGITGGFENLVPEDVSSARAYKENGNIVLEMQMADQVSGPKEDALSGSVGHAITAVGDISIVINDLSDRGLPLELSEEDTSIHYTNATVKVAINSNGEIVSGMWRYTVDIRMNNFKAFGKNLEKASVLMDNIIEMK